MLAVKILVADDHVLYRAAICSLLGMLPNAPFILQADNGLDAIRMCRNDQIDILILDIRMPECDGLQVIKSIRMKQKLCKTKIVALTLYNDANFIANLLKLGADAFLSKHCEPQEILNTVTALLDGTYPCDDREPYLISGHKSFATPCLAPIEISPRERRLLEFLSRGMSSKEIAKQLHIPYRTVESQRTRLERKMQVRNTAHLIDYAYRNGILDVVSTAVR